VFLSHAGADRAFVESEILPVFKDGGVDAWYSEMDIPPSKPFDPSILSALRESEWFLLVMSNNSVNSDWVKSELAWALDHRSDPARLILVKIDECNPEEFSLRLVRFQHIDYRNPDARMVLQDFIATHLGGRRRYESQTAGVRDLVLQLRHVRIQIPLQPDIRVVRNLNALPRKGKLLRLRRHNLKTECRSVLDHIFSVAHTADVFLPHIDHGLGMADVQRLASCIAFHDVCEVLIDDHADFTSHMHMPPFQEVTQAERKKVERAANTLISPWLEPWLRRNFDYAISIIEDPQSSVAKFLRIIDKIDPIIGIWRYLHHFRERLDVRTFLRAMDDFFSNPNVRSVVEECDIDRKRVGGIVDLLQTRDNARNYYSDKRFPGKMEASAQVPSGVLRRLIEDRKLHFVPAPPE
jgi:5'-deoxynucleotidase YfbR-like HD superfamily hydrolase